MGSEQHAPRRRIPAATPETEDDGSTASVAGAPGHARDEALVPEVVVEALIETAWAFPGLRVSCARLVPDRRLHVLAAAGGGRSGELAGEHIALKDGPDVMRALSRGHVLRIEDVAVDSRLHGIRSELSDRSALSLLVLPIRNETPPRLFLGAVMFDGMRPRTWSSREEVALERLAPIVGLAFENAALSEALTERTAEVATSQRQTDALRGLVGGAVHDAHLLLDALLELQRPPSRQGTGDSIAAIERELRSQLEHLASLPGGEYTRRGHAEVDLNALVVDAAPILRSILGPEIRMLVRPDRNPARVRANRRGLDRMLRSLVTVVGRAGDGQDLVLRVVQKRGRVRVELAGPAVGIDDRVIGVAAGATSSVDEVGFDLWQVRCEALLNNLHLGVRKRTDGDVVYFELARSG